MQSADTNYSPRPWMQNTPPQSRPNTTYQDQLTAEALATSMIDSADEIRMIRPPLPITAFPPKFGYRVDALGIDDLVQLNRIYPRADFSGRQSGYQGTSFPSLNQF